MSRVLELFEALKNRADSVDGGFYSITYDLETYFVTSNGKTASSYSFEIAASLALSMEGNKDGNS